MFCCGCGCCCCILLIDSLLIVSLGQTGRKVSALKLGISRNIDRPPIHRATNSADGAPALLRRASTALAQSSNTRAQPDPTSPDPCVVLYSTSPPRLQRFHLAPFSAAQSLQSTIPAAPITEPSSSAAPFLHAQS